MPSRGWVIDLGANRGLFSVWAALSGAQVVAVEAQEGFAPLITALAEHNYVAERVKLEIRMASGASTSGAAVGVVADDLRWAATSHGAPVRPLDMSMQELMSEYGINQIGLLKIDIEGGEFAVLGGSENLTWLSCVDQVVLEVHHDHGDAAALIERLEQLGFAVHLCDNDGAGVAASSGHLAYAYCRR